eukprot:101798-Prorocentrum_minimum.AAC.2
MHRQHPPMCASDLTFRQMKFTSVARRGVYLAVAAGGFIDSVHLEASPPFPPPLLRLAAAPPDPPSSFRGGACVTEVLQEGNKHEYR